MTNLTQPGATGPDQNARHSAEHAGSYMHRPAPHLDPAPIVDHLAVGTGSADALTASGRNAEHSVHDLEKAAKEAAEREAEIDRRISAATGQDQASAEAE